jgi:SAM-dependent methyltransferase
MATIEPLRHEIDLTRVAVDQYDQRLDVGVVGAERTAAERYLAGNRVLDLGCGTGRLLPVLAPVSEVIELDLSEEALALLRTRTDVPWAPAIRADARSLPFKSGSFGGVMFAYNGLDFVVDPHDRRQTLQDLERIIRPGGWLIFSSHNPVGELLTPRGLRSKAMWRHRARYLFTGQIFRRVFRDSGARLLYHASPGAIVREVHASTSFRLHELMDRTGRIHNRRLLHAFSAWPYYVFKR